MFLYLLYILSVVKINLMQSLKTLTNISLLIALYFFIYYTYTGLLLPFPGAGDSWSYHIPISFHILNGSFIAHPESNMPNWHIPGTNIALLPSSLWYNPGSSEAINALFLLFHIPITISAVFAGVALLFSLWKLGITFRLSKYYSLLFALTFTTTNVVIRWLNAVGIDIWVAVWFVLSIVLLEQPKKNTFYFTKLGFVLGMLIGSKYTTLYFLIILLVMYLRNILRYVSLVRIVAFFIPFSIFGIFWYIRNYFLTGNPFYPVAALGFNGPYHYYSDTVWVETLRHPIDMFNAAFGEYHLWLFSILIALYILIKQYVIQRKLDVNSITKLSIMGLLSLISFFTFPTSSPPAIMVSSFRYSLPVFIPLMLCVFLLGSKYKTETLIGYIAIASMIDTISMAYDPKLILLYLPIALAVIYAAGNDDVKRRRLKAFLYRFVNNFNTGHFQKRKKGTDK
jgi:hypothetical protein